MRRSETITSFATALAKAQAEFAPVIKGKQAKITERQSYSYADLAAVCASIVPVLSKHGIAVVQGSTAGALDVLETMLIHGESGEWIASDSPIYDGRNGGAQGWGSGVTYARRYGLLAAVGVAPEDDDDGEKASGSNKRAKSGAATEGLDQAWHDAVEDALPPNATGRQRAQAYVNQIIEDMGRLKTVSGIDGIWSKREETIEKIKRSQPDLYEELIDRYTGLKEAILNPEPEAEHAD